MQFTFTLDGNESPETYRRLIAALVVIGDVEVPPAAQPDSDPLALSFDKDQMQLAFGYIAPPMTLEEAVEVAREAADTVQRIAPPLPPDDEPEANPAEMGFGDPELRQDREDLQQVIDAPPGPELDSAGRPWNAEIHAGSKTKIGNGTWRRKPGVSAERVVEVEAEQDRVAGLTPKTPPAPPVPPADDSTPPPPPPPEDETDPTTPADFFGWAVTRGLGTDRIKAACVAVGLVDAHGVGQPSLLLTKAEFLPHLVRELRS
jgi:hypothetical protein